jgi:hypothetical protein
MPRSHDSVIQKRTCRWGHRVRSKMASKNYGVTLYHVGGHWSARAARQLRIHSHTRTRTQTASHCTLVCTPVHRSRLTVPVRTVTHSDRHLDYRTAGEESTAPPQRQSPTVCAGYLPRSTVELAHGSPSQKTPSQRNCSPFRLCSLSLAPLSRLPFAPNPSPLPPPPSPPADPPPGSLPQRSGALRRRMRVR